METAFGAIVAADSRPFCPTVTTGVLPAETETI